MQYREYSIGRWISILYRYGKSNIDRKLEHYGIGSGCYIILLTLYRNGGIRQEELSNFLKIDKGSIAKSVKKLEEDDYIERKTDVNDKRAYKIFLTQKSIDIIPSVQKAIEEWEELIVSDLSENEKQIIGKLLCKMASTACGTKMNDKEDNR